MSYYETCSKKDVSLTTIIWKMVHICKINVIFDLSCSEFIMTVNYRTISDQERDMWNSWFSSFKYHKIILGETI